MPGTRPFFIACFAVALLLVIVVPALGGMFSARPMPGEAAQGFALWRADNCAGCHTMDGLGGVYAPDLTRIYSTRGENYLREFLVNPGAFHPDAIRIMPRLGLTLTETDNLMAFLKWVDDHAGSFPPRPIRVSGGLPEGAVAPTNAASSSTSAVPSDPAAAGHYWFSRPPANCATCHSLEPGVVIVGPSLAGVALRAQTRVAGMSAEQYLRTSILDPGTFVVPGFPDAMARNFGDVLNAEQISDIIAFLLTQDQAP